MEKLVMYQEGNKFVMTRKKEVDKLDAEEVIRNLDQSREQLEELKKNVKEFERDIKVMETFEEAAKALREGEIKQGRKDREDAKRS